MRWNAVIFVIPVSEQPVAFIHIILLLYCYCKHYHISVFVKAISFSHERTDLAEPTDRQSTNHESYSSVLVA